MSKTTKVFLVLLILAASGAGWYFYEQSIPVVAVRPIVRGPITHAVPANVLVLAQSDRPIKSEYAGRILKVHVKLGSEVKANDPLFDLDTRDLDLEIRRTETDYDAAKERIEKVGSPLRFELQAAEETERVNKRLLELGKLSQIDLDRQKRAKESLQDRIKLEDIANKQLLANFETTLAQKRLQKEKMRIVAPLDGTITELDAANYDLVGGGQVLARIISKERLVQAQISEENFAGIRPGLVANVQFLGYGARLFQATVDRVLPSADARTKRYIAFLQVDIPEDQLMPDLTGEASITLAKKENVLLAPSRGLVGHQLFVVKDGRAKLTKALIGLTGLGSTEIEMGVSEGELVISQDAASIQDGQKVRTKRARN